MDTADEERRLPVLILHVGLHATAYQKLDDIFLVAAARDVEWGRKMRVNKIGLGAGPFEQEHEDVGLA